jgi:hypothetical protein
LDLHQKVETEEIMEMVVMAVTVVQAVTEGIVVTVVMVAVMVEAQLTYLRCLGS